MILASAPVVTFRCPGETYDISPAIHRARQAAGYEKCRFCSHCDSPLPTLAPPSTSLESTRDGNGLPDTTAPASSDSEDSPRKRGLARRLFRRDGVRGVYLNEIDRRLASELAGAFACELWNREPVLDLTGPRPGDPTPPPVGKLATEEGVTVLQPGLPGPRVVLAHDDRPSGPDLATGVCLSLRRMGCQVIDIGQAARPEFWFAVQHLQAAGGVHVCGAGTAPSCSGLDLVGRHAEPWSLGGDLDAVRDIWLRGYERPSRRPGGLARFRSDSLYAARCVPLVHGLRPLKIAWSCAPRTIAARTARLLTRSACRLLSVEMPTRERRLSDEADVDLVRLSQQVISQGAHLGVLVDDDGQHCAVFDERGQRVPPTAIAKLLTDDAVRGGALLPPEVSSAALELAEPADSLQAAYRQMMQRGAACGHGPPGCHWFADPLPLCDGMETLLRLLQALSRSDAPLSQLLSTGM